MSDSLRDQLLGLGFKGVPKPAARVDPRAPKRAPSRDRHPSPRSGKGGKAPAPHRQPTQARPVTRPAQAPRTQEDIDLARAYAIRAQRDKTERIEAERTRQEEARARREAKARLTELLTNRSLNDPAADIARHFPYGDKIKRVHVTAEQLTALNAGLLGVVQLDGRYLLVNSATLAQAEAIFPPAIALKVDPDLPAGDDRYADPRYQVPDDLVW